MLINDLNKEINTNKLHFKTVKKPLNYKVTRLFNSKISAGNQKKVIQPQKMQANMSEKKKKETHIQAFRGGNSIFEDE